MYFDNIGTLNDLKKSFHALARRFHPDTGNQEASDAKRKRADNCRYYHMAHAIIGTKNYIYHGDYDQAMTNIFGKDVTNI